MKKTAWTVGIGIVVFGLLLGAVGLFARGHWGYRYWGMMGGPGMMGGFGIIGSIIMLLFWALVIAGVVWLVLSVAQGAGQSKTEPRSSETPLDILKRRYAAGEINKEQFDEMKRSLEA